MTTQSPEELTPSGTLRCFIIVTRVVDRTCVRRSLARFIFVHGATPAHAAPGRWTSRPRGPARWRRCRARSRRSCPAPGIAFPVPEQRVEHVVVDLVQGGPSASSLSRFSGRRRVPGQSSSPSPSPHSPRAWVDEAEARDVAPCCERVGGGGSGMRARQRVWARAAGSVRVGTVGWARPGWSPGSPRGGGGWGFGARRDVGAGSRLATRRTHQVDEHVADDLVGEPVQRQNTAGSSFS